MVLTGPVKPEATFAVTCTGEVTVLLLSGVEMVTPPVPVREAVRSLEACRCWRKATAPAARMRTTARTIYWIKPPWKRETREEFIKRIRTNTALSSSQKWQGFYLSVFLRGKN